MRRPKLLTLIPLAAAILMVLWLAPPIVSVETALDINSGRFQHTWQIFELPIHAVVDDTPISRLVAAHGGFLGEPDWKPVRYWGLLDTGPPVDYRLGGVPMQLNRLKEALDDSDAPPATQASLYRAALTSLRSSRHFVVLFEGTAADFTIILNDSDGRRIGEYRGRLK